MATNALHSPPDIPSRGPLVLAVTSSTLAVCTLFVGLRLTSRFGVVKKPGWDDYTIILAWILAFGTSFSICYGTRYGLGRHEQNIPDEWEIAMKKCAYVFSVLYNPALMATKTSILIFYLGLSKTQKIFRWATIATFLVVNIGGLALTLLNTLQCRPVSAAYSVPTPKSASCTNIVTIYLSSAPLNIITDLAILFLPMPILTSMRLPRKQKTILVITFGFGIFVTIVDVVRIAYLQNAARDNLRAVQAHREDEGSDSRDTNDFSWYASLSFMWSAIEINVGIMCGCVPALKPLVSRFLPTWILDHTVREKSGTQTSDSVAIHPDIVSTHRVSNRSDPTDPPVSPLSRPSPAVLSTSSNGSGNGKGNSNNSSGNSNGNGNGNGNDQTMGMMDFLTTPDMNEMSHLQPTNTYATYATTARTRRGSLAFFDFVDMGKKKNITLRTNGESVYPILMVTVLFFIWGFAYGLLDTLNAQFQEVANMSQGQTAGNHSAYYVGYMIGPLTFGRLVFRHWGFKACYTVGLVVYACGTLIFWPSAVLTSFPAFLISNFIVGMGLSTLEISANSFIALCGPPEYAEIRLNISQAFQGIGSILSPLLAKKVLFKAQANSLIDVQWTYLGICFFTIILSILYFYVPLPEATDQELEDASARLPIPRDSTFGSSKIKIIWITLGLGVFSQFCYVGAQESVATTFQEFIKDVMPSLDSVGHQAVGHTAFTVSRFVAAFANIWIKPRYLLLFFYTGTIVFAAACMTGSGAAPSANVIMLMFFEGPLFALIFAQPLRGLGKHTKDGAVLLTAAIGGGAVFPPAMYGAMKARNAQYAFCVAIAAFAAGTLFPLWLNLFPTARQLADPVRDEQARRISAQEHARRDSAHPEEKKKRFSSIKKRFSIGKDKETGDLPTVEHRERRSFPEGTNPAQKAAADTPDTTTPFTYAWRLWSMMT
ncbi:MFS monosaccharide transporter-like protein [Dendryphion nanum]|uniref:MFS monosaccharide transporter-like protein n=1 Tax=Dendryphion nanum TaxID=256645 RepID=A0A9P9DTZ9_9PLEO|nr:MFS monosaccharide transporter-like protein [Dendryphion nanum]